MRNSIAGEDLRRYIDRIEDCRARKKEIAEEEKLVFAELKASGYSPATVRDVLKIRAAKPADYAEAEAMLDTYRAALGMLAEAPLFHQVGLMSVDITARESVIEAFKKLVPATGDITINMGGRPVRLWRDETGAARAEDVIERPAPPEAAVDLQERHRRKPVAPDVDLAGAEALGHEAGKANQPVITNPFPFGDPRRAGWDLGWRKATGSDGMGRDD